ncbi:MAG: hypothetical protein PHE27_08960 [Alphaproteobacteria bacterium]|nr:hypothetical protein [Alphaproteobacteria bacterium]
MNGPNKSGVKTEISQTSKDMTQLYVKGCIDKLRQNGNHIPYARSSNGHGNATPNPDVGYPLNGSSSHCHRPILGFGIQPLSTTYDLRT